MALTKTLELLKDGTVATVGDLAMFLANEGLVLRVSRRPGGEWQAKLLGEGYVCVAHCYADNAGAAVEAVVKFRAEKRLKGGAK
jgi:hypothetical protein